MPDARISVELVKIERELPAVLSLILNPAPADPVTGRRRVDDWRLAELAMRAEALARQAGLDPEKTAKGRADKQEKALPENVQQVYRRIKILHKKIISKLRSER